jgi:hypothetical protein
MPWHPPDYFPRQKSRGADAELETERHVIDKVGGLQVGHPQEPRTAKSTIKSSKIKSQGSR